MAYQYRGNIHDVATEPTPIRPAKPHNTDKCGTVAGRRAHARNNTEPCQPCKDAFAEYQRGLRKNTPQQATFRTDKCGTYAGYCRHKRYKVASCTACREANATYMRNLRRYGAAV